MTKTKRSNGSSLVTVSISHSLCFGGPLHLRDRVLGLFDLTRAKQSRFAFSMILRLTQDRAHSLKTVSSLRDCSTVKTKHGSDSL
jgi:hypothetical protein